MTNDSFSDTTMALLTAESVSWVMAVKISLPDGTPPAGSPVCQATLLALIVTPKPFVGPPCGLAAPLFGSMRLLYRSTLQPVRGSNVVGAYLISQSAMSPSTSLGAL